MSLKILKNNINKWLLKDYKKNCIIYKISLKKGWNYY
jgi:hypothetical protein